MMRSTIASVAAALLLGCGGNNSWQDPKGTIPFEPQRPDVSTPGTVTPYAGADPIVMDAQTRMPTGLDLQRKVILRTCGPTNGVCHNQKEYPDLHTTGTFASAINAPCNLQPGTYASVFDRCERLGDRFKLEDNDKFPANELGWYEVVVGAFVEYEDDETPPSDAAGLHLHLRDPVPLERGRAHWGTGTFLRSFVDAAGNKVQLSFATYNSRWWVLDDGRHLYAEVHDYQAEDVESLQRVGIIQGDQNRNGEFGAREGRTVPLINPGKPEESYLVARLRGHMQGEPIPGTRMPLANQPPSVTDMLALMCWVEGLNAEATSWNLTAPIDYSGCSYIANPQALNLVGAGVTWRQRVQQILQSSCGGCHGGANPQAGLDMLSDGAWQRLRGFSTQNPTLKLIDPGRPEKSYLWLKLAGDGSIIGRRMPLDPLNNGSRSLPDDQLNDIQTWILAGALEDG